MTNKSSVQMAKSPSSVTYLPVPRKHKAFREHRCLSLTSQFPLSPLDSSYTEQVHFALLSFYCISVSPGISSNGVTQEVP